MNKILNAYMRNNTIFKTVYSHNIKVLPIDSVLFSIYKFSNMDQDMFYICKKGIYRKRFIHSLQSSYIYKVVI